MLTEAWTVHVELDIGTKVAGRRERKQ